MEKVRNSGSFLFRDQKLLEESAAARNHSMPQEKDGSVAPKSYSGHVSLCMALMCSFLAVFLAFSGVATAGEDFEKLLEAAVSGNAEAQAAIAEKHFDDLARGLESGDTRIESLFLDPAFCDLFAKAQADNPEARKLFGMDDPDLPPPAPSLSKKNFCDLIGSTLFGKTTPEADFVKARKGAEAGDPEAQALLAYCFCVGSGTNPDALKAAELIGKAAKNGSARAQYILSMMHEAGLYVEESRRLSQKWLEESARNGYPEAQYLLGSAYETGFEREQSYKLARQWYEKAASQGNADAKLFLGGLYESGKGGEQSCKQAWKLYREACGQGIERGCEEYSRLEKECQ